MKLEDIGFYTLSDYRVSQASAQSPLWRCELILTDRCNFKCNYCRGLKTNIQGDLNWNEAHRIVDYWISQGLKNIRFSGGEPMVKYDLLCSLVRKCKKAGVEHIAISTNGSYPLGKYYYLHSLGVNDFSISFDSAFCCTAELMSGKCNSFETICTNIEELARITYVTLGIVFTPDNVGHALDTIGRGHSFNPADIRIIPSAQYNKQLSDIGKNIDNSLLECHPILKYRINNIRDGRHVRGIDKSCDRCYMALDDMAVAQGYHFPCIIYMREQGDYIGKIGAFTRRDRFMWVIGHDISNDPICKKNCLDVCVDYNMKFKERLLNGQ